MTTMGMADISRAANRIFILAILLTLAGCRSDDDPSAISISFDSSTEYTAYSTKEIVLKKNWIGGADILLRAEFRCRGQKSCRPDLVDLLVTTPETDSHNLRLVIDGKTREFGELHFFRNDSFFTTKDISTGKIPYLTFFEFASATRVEAHLGEFVFTLDPAKLLPFKNLTAQAGLPSGS